MKNIQDILQEIIAEAASKAGYTLEKKNITIEATRQESHGDLATNAALRLASVAKKSPRQVAEELIKYLKPDTELIERVEIAGPGFINFFLGWGYYREVLRAIIQAEKSFGLSNIGNGERLQIEFVSANPTGPLNVVSARAAAIGDVMVNLYNAVGFKADREFYLNDAGRQVRLLGASVSSRYMALFGKEEPFPEDGYHGDYVIDLAKEIKDEFGDKFVSLAEAQRVEELKNIALEKMIRAQKEMMAQYRVNFQNWFRESSLREKNAHLKVLNELRQKGYTYEQDGAVWFRSSEFDDEKDRVLITSEGEPTYFLVDIAYHQTKYERGYKKLYDIWGPDHHGYVPRMKAALLALGHPKDSFHVEIVQQVNLLRSGEQVKMSKRAGQIIEMKELIEEVGVDAARFFFVNRKCSSHLDFDIELAKKQSEENPVYYVQYAHARICNILKYAAEQGLKPAKDAELSPIKEPEEKLLIKKLLQYPDIVQGAALAWEPHRLTNYLQETAAAFHHFYHKHRVVTENRELSLARLKLAQATKTVLANAFSILGITAPEYM
ncbi:MAG: arginine--tRNA ligase [Calditrichaeota bacterium]|nr:arginine--tRNA ligase [Calditrichota bacterium]